MKLGRLPAARNPLVPRLRAVLPNLPPAPDVVNWWATVPAWQMLGNDSCGDCVFAALGHAIMAMSSYTKAPLYPSADDCLADYSAITGYNPADPSTDNGAVIETVLAYAQKTGLSLGPAKHKIQAFASVNFADLDEVKPRCSRADSISTLRLEKNRRTAFGMWETSPSPLRPTCQRRPRGASSARSAD